jgi:hypothetical protein
MEEAPVDITFEVNDSNFGHGGLVFKGGPILKDINYINTNADYKNTPEDIKAKLPANLNLTSYEERVKLSGEDLVEQKGMFTLWRYNVSSNITLPPNSTKEPTLSMSLFMPNDKLPEDNIIAWNKRYLTNQLKLCFIFNYYFPNGNYRNYFDWYMINKFSKMNGDDESLKFNNIDYRSFTLYKDFGKSDEECEKITNLLKLIYNNLSIESEKKTFTNGASRFIYYFITISKMYVNESNEIETREKYADLFVYKLDGPFIENKDSANGNEGHITNGYIGQHMRFISLKQNEYNYNGKTIPAPNHLVWRDAHSNKIGALDSEWIRELNTLSVKNSSDPIYFLPISLGYVMNWHGRALCKENNTYMQRTAIAGVIQICNSTIKNNNLLYLQTIGLPFIISKDDKLPIYDIRPVSRHYNESFNDGNPLNGYNYGIDEFILTEFFNRKEIMKSSIYFNYKLAHEFLANIRQPSLSIQIKVILILLGFLDRAKIIRYENSVSRKEIIVGLETLRENKQLIKEDDRSIVGYLLSLVPNKYHLQACIFDNATNYDHIFNFNFTGNKNGKVAVIDIFEGYLKDKVIDVQFYSEFDKFVDNTKGNLSLLEKIGIDCQSAIIHNTVGEWCQEPYLKSYFKDTLKTGCNSADYFSGFYKDSPPSLDIGILRRPTDLKSAFTAMKNNKLLNPLNKTNYKISTKFPNKEFLITDLMPAITFVDGYPLIEYGKLNDIFKEYNVDDYVYIKKQTLVWKVLNFCGYDIPPSYFNTLELKNDDEYKEFNDRVKKFAEIKVNGISWADDTFIKLATKLPPEELDSINENISNINNVKKKYSMQLINGGNKNSSLALSIMGGLYLNLEYLMIALVICLTIFLLVLIKKKFDKKKQCDNSYKHYYHQYPILIYT